MSDMSDEVIGISGRKYKIPRTPPFKPYESEKEWSLKYKSFIKDTVWVDEDTEVYSKADIEILRKKLIEDFNERIDRNNGIHSKHTIEYIINQRFGVEEKQ